MHVITCTLILPLKDLPKKVDNLERFQSEKQYKVYRCISVKKKMSKNILPGFITCPSSSCCTLTSCPTNDNNFPGSKYPTLPSNQTRDP